MFGKKIKETIVAVSTSILVLISMTTSASGASENLQIQNGNAQGIENSVLGDSFYEAIAEKDRAIERLKAARFNYPYSCSVDVTWQQQQNNYYCGPATATMMLGSFMSENNLPTQNLIASDTYLRTTESGGTPWFSGTDSMVTSSPYYYNMPYGLNLWQYNRIGRRNWNYTPYPYNKEVPTDEKYIENIKFAIYSGVPVAIFGYSGKVGSPSHMNNYPDTGVTHWVVCYGWSGDDFLIADPAAGIFGFEKVSSKYSITKEKLLNFIYLGIVC